jgi:hypothetical protein
VLGHVNGSDAGPEAPDREALRELVHAAEHLPQLVGKLTGYAEQAGTNTALTMPLLFCFPTPRREQTARKALAATAASDPRLTCPACDSVWLPLHGGHPPMRLIDLGGVLPDPWRTEPEHDEQDQHELDPAETGWDEVESDRL